MKIKTEIELLRRINNMKLVKCKQYFILYFTLNYNTIKIKIPIEKYRQYDNDERLKLFINELSYKLKK